MLIRRGFKFELKPNGMQIQLMKQFCGCARYVYNRTLSLERSLYKKDNKHSFKYAEAANRLPEWKKKNPFLKECHSQVLQQSLKDLDQAYTNFFRKRANFPKYKEKFRNDSIRFPQDVELDEAKQQIRLPISSGFRPICVTIRIGRLSFLCDCIRVSRDDRQNPERINCFCYLS